MVLRKALIGASESARLRRMAEDSAVAHRVVDRFVAGEGLDAAAAAIVEHDRHGKTTTLDHLGESVDDEAGARHAAEAYRQAIARIAADGLPASVSAKPTQLGLDVDPGLFATLVRELCEQAGEHDIHVTLDMEDSDTTDATVDLVAELVAEGHQIGCAVQAYLHRTPRDVRRLTDLGASLRICKGAYAEPEERALQGKQEIREAFLALAETVLDSDVYGRFATHDDWLIDRIGNLAAAKQRGPDTWEFQMLHGVRPTLEQQIVERGHALRIYVPYGTEWYPYFVRRLAERPANLTFFLRSLVGRR